ncbi:MAG: hypothetical protein KDC90_14200 [Ignavibacteriae bacterium]|nr:hypothetical protein [Ignavibacteriota bacterium]
MKPTKYYISPLLIAFLIFLSNFLNTQLFGSEIVNFVVWFILSLFVFATGWFTNNTLGWVHGGKIVFAVIVAMAILSAVLVSFFSDYFLTESLLFENIILYSLRNIMLGSMAFFGMSLSEVITQQRGIENLKNQENKSLIKEDQANSAFIKNEAKIIAEKIVSEANKIAAEIISKK